MKTTIGFIIILFFVLAGCDELVRTQRKEADVTFSTDGQPISGEIELVADGKSMIRIDAATEWETAPGQSIVFTTTEGSLHLLNDTAFDSENKSVSIEPKSNIASVLLKAGNVVDPKVLVGVTVNNFTRLTQVNFKRACPGELFIAEDIGQISVSANEPTDLVIQLVRNDGSTASDGTRVEISADPDGIVGTKKNALSEDGSVTFGITGKAEGEVTLTASVTSEGCPAVPVQIEVSVVP